MKGQPDLRFRCDALGSIRIRATQPNLGSRRNTAAAAPERATVSVAFADISEGCRTVATTLPSSQQQFEITKLSRRRFARQDGGPVARGTASPAARHRPSQGGGAVLQGRRRADSRTRPQCAGAVRTPTRPRKAPRILPSSLSIYTAAVRAPGGRPFIRRDTGPEFVSNDVHAWIEAVGAMTAFIAPARPRRLATRKASTGASGRTAEQRDLPLSEGGPDQHRKVERE